MVKEQIIEQQIELYNKAESSYVEDLALIMETQPSLLAFLNQESLDILLEEEKDILWYIVLIVYSAIEKQNGDVIGIDSDALSQNEENNWTIFQEQPRGAFRDKVTVFFKGYHQEDLLAFVEDTLELDENSPITSVGRDVIFITAKSLIDTLLPQNY